MAVPFRLMSKVNHADVAAIGTSATPLLTLPASNLKDDDIRMLWRSTSTSGDSLIVDLGSAVEIGAVSLINTNLRSTDTVQIKVSNSDPTGQTGEIYNSGVNASSVDPFYAKLVHFIEPAVIGRYVRISMITASAPQAGRLVICPIWIPSRNWTYGLEKLARDFSIRTRSESGNEYVDIRDRQRGVRLTVRGLTEVELNTEVDVMHLIRGVGRDILLCLNKDSDNLGRDTFWGLLEVPFRQRLEALNFWVLDIEIWDRN